MSKPIVGSFGMSEPQRQVVADLIPPVGTFLEIGTADGATAAWIADRRPAAEVISIDLFPTEGSGVQGMIGNIALWQQNRRPNMHLWVGTANSLERLLQPSCQFDVILVDGEHTYESCHRDIDVALRLVTPAGAICLDDYENRQNGVLRAYKEVAARIWAVERIQGSMAVLRASGEESDPDRVRRLKELGYV